MRIKQSLQEDSETHQAAALPSRAQWCSGLVLLSSLPPEDPLGNCAVEPGHASAALSCYNVCVCGYPPLMPHPRLSPTDTSSVYKEVVPNTMLSPNTYGKGQARTATHRWPVRQRDLHHGTTTILLRYLSET